MWVGDHVSVCMKFSRAYLLSSSEGEVLSFCYTGFLPQGWIEIVIASTVASQYVRQRFLL